MFVLVLDEAREPLRQFNDRIAQICAEHPVVGLEAATIGGDKLMIQLTMADDTDAIDVPTFTAVTRLMDPESPTLEEDLQKIIDQEQKKHMRPQKGQLEGEPNVPVRLIPCAGLRRSWVVVLCINGDAGDDGEDGGEDEEGDPENGPDGEPRVEVVSNGPGFQA